MSTRRLRGAVPAMPLMMLAVSLLGCSAETVSELPGETLVTAPVDLRLEAQGQLKATRSQPLLVPGTQWQQRTLEWLRADGSRVEAGEVVARFSAAESALELDKALLDLQRNALARAAKQHELAATQGRVGVDLAQVSTDFSIAERYAGADLMMLSRNEILDAIQDKGFLGVKRGVLEWREDQAADRGAAELAVLDAQKATHALSADSKQKDLDALELRAPNAGVLVLTADWSGEKPKTGSTQWAGEELASLPDASSLEVEASLPQLAAQGLTAGLSVELHPVGRPDQRVESRLEWVASAAQQRGRRNPIKFVSMKAPVPADAATRHGWVPGQAFEMRIVVHRADAGLTVPNVALKSDGGVQQVFVADGDGWQPRTVTLGARGPARSVVVDGLQPGDRVLLTPGEAGSAP